MAEATATVALPAGHADTVKLLSTVAVTGGDAGRPAGCGRRWWLLRRRLRLLTIVPSAPARVGIGLLSPDVLQQCRNLGRRAAT